MDMLIWVFLCSKGGIFRSDQPRSTAINDQNDFATPTASCRSTEGVNINSRTLKISTSVTLLVYLGFEDYFDIEHMG